MRICSLIPGATEVIVALGLEDQLVGISHECDFPPSIHRVPVMIQSLVDAEHSTSSGVDQRVKDLVRTGHQLYQLREEAFLQARPDLILTQDLCHVCSVTPDQLTRAMQLLQRHPELLILSPTTLEDMIHDIERIADAVGAVPKGEALVATLRDRLERVRLRTEKVAVRPRVVCLEWLDPLYVAGHWVPEMVDLAGGYNVLGSKNSPSYQTTWDEVATAQPDVVIVMPCGYSVDRTLNELRQAGSIQAAWQRAQASWSDMYLVDAGSYFSRPGPRLIDGVELLADILHPNQDYPLDCSRAIKCEPSVLAGDCAS
ncbi:ABC-type transport system periplasmic binding protein [Candidatus Nitrospira nitrosa]|uniref:ABC-type transport system periplasmic binding protein n=1 Tax=Candidatus Nitrospira nitrosa TaxID=1742972 RepID=A0A0S4LJX1_9BACT|nr:cobalamin-binding protein [Candidatus Nitrospira nitrosa]CUS37891.1 ABC-type transport system periplasmic binding protein [Candidatus Nitrospira nitrosa]